ncbi:MAG TPA: tandem-95 repeat protein, partial [Rhodocyclaceae bacterium]|nr:tandem-95 repeat protein [Rhodocyclaceae bacterium]
NGTPGSLTARLIDDSAGAVTSGNVVNVTVSGGTTPYSNGANAVTLNTTVTPVNDAPVNTVPGAQSTNEDTALYFNAGINQISIADIDAGASAVRVTLTATNGTIILNGTTGLTFSVGDGVADATMTFTGTVTNINSALNGMMFTPTSNYFGAASLQIVTNDQGNTGSGGALSATDVIGITVNPVADTPSVTNATTNEDTQTTSGLVISRAVADGAEVTHFKITGITNGTLYKNDGVTQITNGTFITFAEGNAGLKFTPAANFNGTGSFTVQASTSNGDAGLGGSTVNATVTVISVNDAPAGTDKTVTTNEDTAYTFTGADFGFTDPNDAPANTLLAVRISTLPGAGTLTDNGVAVTAGQFVSVADINAGKLVFTPALSANGAGYASFTFQVQDDGGIANGGTDLDQSPNIITINVTPVNDPPVNTVPGAQTVAEDTALAIGGLSVNDVDGNLTTTRLTVLDGTLNVNLAGGATISAGATGSATLTLAGTQAQINAALSTLTYQGNLNYNGGDTLTMLSTDGAGATDTDTVAVTITAVNDAPVATITPASYGATEQTTLTLHGTGLSIADVDAGGAVVQATVAVASGTLNAGAGTTGVAVAGSGTSTITLTGTLVQINALLAGNLGGTLTYIFSGNAPPPTDTLTLTANDLGNTGAGGPLTGSAAVTINITAVNDPPTTGNSGGGTAEDGAYAAIMLIGADVDGTVTNFQLTSLPANGTLYLDSALTMAMTTGTDYAATSQQLVVYFAPNANWNGTTSFQYAAKDNLGLMDATPATGTLTLTPANDAPTRTAASVSLASVPEDTANPAGATVSSLFAPAFSDVADQVAGGSSANAFAGVAIVANGANAASEGVWQWYNGSSWTAIGTSVSTGSALTLSAGTLVRFLPNANWNGTPGSLTARLIDDSAGAVTSGNVVNVTVSGGTTPYSNGANAVVLNTIITPVNDAPTTAPVTLVAIAEDSGARLITQAELLANAGDIEGDALVASGLTITAGNGSLTDNGNGTWTYSPAANDDTGVSFSYTITDNGRTNGVADPKTVAGSATLDITPVNDPVVVVGPPPGPVSVPPIVGTGGTGQQPKTTESAPAFPGGGRSLIDSGSLQDSVRAGTVEAAPGPGLQISAASVASNVPIEREVLTNPETQGGILLRLLELMKLDSAVGVAGHGATGPHIQVDILQDEDFKVEVLTRGAQISAVSLSVGAVWWALRAGGLFTSALVSLPAWRTFDVLPVLSRREDDDEDDAAGEFGPDQDDPGHDAAKRSGELSA